VSDLQSISALALLRSILGKLVHTLVLSASEVTAV